MKFELYLHIRQKMPSFYKNAIAEYDKRLGRYGKISLHLIKKDKEWLKLLREAEDGFLVLPGDTESSEELSQRIGSWEQESRKCVSFYIDENMTQFDVDFSNQSYIDRTSQSDTDLSNHLSVYSLSDFQMNGPMMAMILYEQIYRGYRIIHNHPYHK